MVSIAMITTFQNLQIHENYVKYNLGENEISSAHAMTNLYDIKLFVKYFCFTTGFYLSDGTTQNARKKEPF